MQTLWWAADADLLVPPDDLAVLDECYGRLVDVRVALHRETGRPGDVLRLEDQDAVASAIGAASADDLMADVAAAARTIGWIAEGAWRHMSRHQLGHEERVGDGLVVVDRAVELSARADPASDPTIVLRAARVAAQRDVPLSRSTLDRLAEEVDADGVAGAAGRPAPSTSSSLLLSQGHRAIDVLESLDQRGILVRLLPEWQPVRSRPQRNAYHRFTVDRHLWETAANAAAPHRPRRPARPARARRPLPRHRQGLPGRPHDGRDGAAAGHRAAARSPGRRRRRARGHGRAPPAAAGRGDPARPHRPGDDQEGRRRGRRRRSGSACSPR